MPVLVDTNVIVDILTDDPQWADWSVAQLQANAGAGLMINPVVYAELCFGSPSVDFVDDVVRRFGLTYQEIPRQGLFRAAKAFAHYRRRQGTKTAVLPDFLIGGHAEAAGVSLLTRDTKRLSTYFPTVALICPQHDGGRIRRTPAGPPSVVATVRRPWHGGTHGKRTSSLGSRRAVR